MATCQSPAWASSAPGVVQVPGGNAGRHREQLYHPTLPKGRAAKRRLPAPLTIVKSKNDLSGLLCVSVNAKWHFFRLFVGTEMLYKLIMSFTVRQETIFLNLR